MGGEKSGKKIITNNEVLKKKLLQQYIFEKKTKTLLPVIDF